MVSKCVRYKHLRGRFQQRKVTSLPKDSVEEKATFTFGGINMLGPLRWKMVAKKSSSIGLSTPATGAEPYMLS